MKRQTFWKIGLSAALIFGLNACSSTSSIDEEEDDEDEIALSSSSGKRPRLPLPPRFRPLPKKAL